MTAEALKAPEKWYPLRVLVCERCWLAQTDDFAAADELFREDYAYFSSFSESWVAHAKTYVDQVVSRFFLDSDSNVVEIASNDGYLLKHVMGRGIPCFGVEPTRSTAEAARRAGLEVVEQFFGVRLGMELAAGRKADLIVANNVLAHVPDINDFVGGFAALLKPDGVATFEFPHLMQLIENTQFDTVYHEHFSYLSLTAAMGILERNGLKVFDVEELVTHGGSLRVFCQLAAGKRFVEPAVAGMIAREARRGLTRADTYAGFQAKIELMKDAFVEFLIDAKRSGKSVAAYGAAAKGNTLLNFAGIRPDLISFVVDRNPAKQGKFMPGSRIPIVAEERIELDKPDFVVILPWNLTEEIVGQLAHVRAWGGQFVTAVPRLEVHG